jgi:hypothetical protein
MSSGKLLGASLHIVRDEDPRGVGPVQLQPKNGSARRCQAAYPLIRISPFDTSTVPGAQTWIGLSHEYSGWLVVSVTFSRS